MFSAEQVSIDSTLYLPLYRNLEITYHRKMGITYISDKFHIKQYHPLM